MEYLILKLPYKMKKVPLMNAAALNQEANGIKGWRINPTRLHQVTNAVLMYQGEILEEYTIGQIVEYDKKNKRCNFDMQPLKSSSLKGKMLSQYKTPNPASLLEQKRLNELLES